MFKDNLISLRKMNHLSQEELAEKLGISRQTLSKYETGESVPDIEKCKVIADYFEVSVDVFFNDIDWNPKTQEITEIDDYYIDENAREYADFLHKNPEYKVLFDASRKVKTEDLQKALKAIGIFIDEE